MRFVVRLDGSPESLPDLTSGNRRKTQQKPIAGLRKMISRLLLICASPMMAFGMAVPLAPAVAQERSLQEEMARLEREGATFMFEGRLVQAADRYEQRYQLMADSFGTDDPRILSVATFVGFLKIQVNQLSDAERYLLLAADGYERSQSAQMLSSTLRMLGNLYLRQGRTRLADQYIERANRILREDGNASEEALILARIDEAMIQFRAENFAGAAARFEAILDGMPSDERNRNATTAIAVYLGLGRAHRQAGNYERAEQAFLSGIAVIDQLVTRAEQNESMLRQIPGFRGFAASSRAVGICLLGGMYLDSGDYHQASQRLVECLSWAGASEGSAFTELFLGTTDLLRLQLIESAEPDTLAATAVVYLDAISDPRLVEIANQELLNRSLGFALYADAAWMIDQHEYRERAFSALQQSVIGPATDSIAEMAARRAASETSSRLGALAQQRTDLVNEIRAYSTQQSASFVAPSGPAQQNRQVVAENLVRAETEVEQIDAELEREFPDFFALINPQPVSIAQTQDFLEAGEAIVLIVPSEFGTHVVAITSDTHAWHRADMAAESVEDIVRRLRWDLGARVPATQAEIDGWQADYPESGEFPFDRQAAFNLYETLIAPVEGAIGDPSTLYVVTGGSLATLPLSVLVTEAPQGADYDPQALRDTAWLADRYALASIPSIQSLQLLRRVENSGGDPITPDFAGFGDPVLQGEAQQRGFRNMGSVPSANAILSWNQTATRSRMADVTLLSQMTRLPGTATELENLRQALGAPEDSLWLGERATETAVRAADLSNASIIAFATHGLMPEELEILTEPGLVFTPPAIATEADDGYLSASEVASLHLNADWVILSACNTATGDNGSGLSELARSFFYAGARNLLASYWPVGDQVASQITVRAFEILRDTPGLSRAQAFQQAMREIRLDPSHDTARTSWAHPAFWAPFVLIGSGT